MMTELCTSEAPEGEKTGCIPNNMKKYMKFNVGQLRFIYSLQFMSFLEKLAANLQMEKLNITSKRLTYKELALLLQKGVYPNEYIESHECFDELPLPLKEAFYSTLSRETISDDDYHHAQNSGRHLVARP